MVTVNGMPLEKYLGQEERVNQDLQDRKGKEIQKFLVFEIKSMRRPGLKLEAASKELGGKELR